MIDRRFVLATLAGLTSLGVLKWLGLSQAEAAPDTFEVVKTPE